MAVGKKIRKARSADVIRLAGVLQVQTVGLLLLLIGAHRHDGLPPPLGAGNVPAGAEEHAVAVLGRNLVEELPEGLVALAPVADVIGHAGGTRGDVRGPVLLAGVVEVAGLGSIKAVVPFGNVLHLLENIWYEWDHPEYIRQSAVNWFIWGIFKQIISLQALVHAPVDAQAVLLLLHTPLAATVVERLLLEGLHGTAALVFGLQTRRQAEVGLLARHALPQRAVLGAAALLLEALVAGFHTV